MTWSALKHFQTYLLLKKIQQRKTKSATIWKSRQIKDALGISGVISSEYSWKTMGTEEEHGAQIDLLIDRSDDVINLCEMKYSKTPFRITKGYFSDLQNKLMRGEDSDSLGCVIKNNCMRNCSKR